MKIRDILREYEINRAEHEMDSVPDFKNTDGGGRVPPNENMIGQGYFSTVRRTTDRPEDVVKGSRPLYPVSQREKHPMSELVDGYFVFVNALASDESVRDNPYFPHIRKFEVYKQTDGRLSYTAELETLEPVSTLKKKEVGHIFRQAAGSEYKYEELKKMVYPSAAIRSEPDNYVYYPMLLLLKIRQVGKQIIEDENLIQALNFIEDLSEKNDYYLDLHEGNLMLRRTSFGTQLVIVDPLGMPK